MRYNKARGNCHSGSGVSTSKVVYPLQYHLNKLPFPYQMKDGLNRPNGTLTMVNSDIR